MDIIWDPCELYAGCRAHVLESESYVRSIKATRHAGRAYKSLMIANWNHSQSRASKQNSVNLLIKSMFNCVWYLSGGDLGL